MKKMIALVLCTTVLMTAVFAGGSSEKNANEIEKLVVGYVPSRPADEILTATAPLEGLLKAELATAGFTVNEVEIIVGTSYEAIGEGLDAGTIHVGLIPGGTYVLYSDGAEVILTATRDGLNKDSDNAMDWNDGKLTLPMPERQVTYYKSLIFAGPSPKGQELAAKVNAGEKLTWEDLNSATWQYMNTTSSAGYIYPTLWLMENYDKTLLDLDNASAATGYGAAFSALKAQTADITMAYADARRDNLKTWDGEDYKAGDPTTIWTDVQVIGVTDGIYNDTISVTRDDSVVTDELKAALQTAFINIGNSEAGKPIIAIYNHNGYAVAKDSDYDGARAAGQLVAN